MPFFTFLCKFFDLLTKCAKVSDEKCQCHKLEMSKNRQL